MKVVTVLVGPARAADRKVEAIGVRRATLKAL
jgi:hypothetical protein